MFMSTSLSSWAVSVVPREGSDRCFASTGTSCDFPHFLHLKVISISSLFIFAILASGFTLQPSHNDLCG